MKWICLKILCTKAVVISDKTSNRMLNITASIYASENGFDNCLLNDSKNVVEAIQGNLLC
jgi:branched-chain amino acid aminotransferase